MLISLISALNTSVLFQVLQGICSQIKYWQRKVLAHTQQNGIWHLKLKKSDFHYMSLHNYLVEFQKDHPISPLVC